MSKLNQGLLGSLLVLFSCGIKENIVISEQANAAEIVFETIHIESILAGQWETEELFLNGSNLTQ